MDEIWPLSTDWIWLRLGSELAPGVHIVCPSGRQLLEQEALNTGAVSEFFRRLCSACTLNSASGHWVSADRIGTGYVEYVDHLPNGELLVSGWSTNETVMLSVLRGLPVCPTVVLELELGVFRERRDLTEVGGRGFRFRFSERSRNVIPGDAYIRVSAKGAILRTIDSVGFTKPLFFGSQVDLDSLLEAGYRLSPKHGLFILPYASWPSELQKDTLELAFELSASLKDLGESAVLAYGSLLGAFRDQSPIPHDDDIDLAVVIQGDQIAEAAREWVRVLLLLRDSGGFEVRVAEDLMHAYVFRAGSTGDSKAHVDLWPVWRLPSGNFFDARGVSVCMDADWALTPIQFGEYTMAAPADADKILTEWFGDNFMIPSPNYQYQDEAKTFESVPGRRHWNEAVAMELARQAFTGTRLG